MPEPSTPAPLPSSARAVVLLKEWGNHPRGAVFSVLATEAASLVKSGAARLAQPLDIIIAGHAPFEPAGA
jgi:hypothetical protein